MSDYTSFKEYFLGFYGAKGIYPDTLPGISTAEFDHALLLRLLDSDIPFEGDSMDRELIRDIAINERGQK